MYDLLLKGGTVARPFHGARRRAGCRGAGRRDRAHRRGHRRAARPRASIDVRGQARGARPDRPARPRVRGLHAHRRESGPGRRATRASRRSSTRAARAPRPSAGSRATSCPTATPRSFPSCTSARPGSPRMPDIIAESSINLDDTLRVAEPAQGPDPRHQGAHGVARARDHGHGDAAAGQARRARERHQADGAHRRHREALRPEVIRSAASAARQGRHPDPLFHRQPGRRARRQRQAGARGARGARPRRVVRHRARPQELQLRRGPPRDRPGPAPALHQHRPHGARPAGYRAQHDGDHDALPRPGLHAGRRW